MTKYSSIREVTSKCTCLQVSDKVVDHLGSAQQPKLVQQANSVEGICQPIVDQVKVWGDIAAAQYRLEGGMEGWGSDEEQPESSEAQYMKVHNPMPLQIQKRAGPP